MIRATSVLMLVAPSGQPMPNSSQIVARSSSAVTFGLRIKATSVAFGDELEEAAADGGLPRPDFAGQQHKAAVAGRAVQQVGEGLPMPVAHVEAGGVGDDRKGFFFQTEIF